MDVKREYAVKNQIGEIEIQLKEKAEISALRVVETEGVARVHSAQEILQNNLDELHRKINAVQKQLLETRSKIEMQQKKDENNMNAIKMNFTEKADQLQERNQHTLTLLSSKLKNFENQMSSYVMKFDFEQM